MQTIKIIFKSNYTQMGQVENIVYETKGTLDRNKRFTKVTFTDGDDIETTIRVSKTVVDIIKGDSKLNFKLNKEIENDYLTEFGNFSLTTKLNHLKNECEIDVEMISGVIELSYQLMIGNDDAGTFNIELEYERI